MAKTKPRKLSIARTQKSREQLIHELKSNTKFVEKMAFTKDKFFPALIAASESVDDAKMFLASISNVLMEKFLGIMKEKKFSELEVAKGLDDKGPKHSEYLALLSLFDDMTVFDAKDLIEGMRNEVELFISEEMKTRGLETLQTKWLDELTK